VAQSKPPLGKGFRGFDRERQGLGLHRLGTAPYQEVGLTNTQFYTYITTFPIKIQTLRTPGFRSKLERFINRAVNQASVSIGNLRGIEIEIPSLDEQFRIAVILDQVDELRRKREKTLALLDDLSRSIFIATFGDLRKNPHGWETKRLAEVLNFPLRNGVSPSNTGTVPSLVLTLSAITGSAFDCDSVKKALFESVIPHDKRVSRDDLLICRGNGNLRLVGKGYFPSADMSDVAFPDTVIAARVSTDQMIPKFLEWLWNSEATRAQIERSARTTNGTYKINQTALQSIEVIVPPINLQEYVASKITSVENLKWLCVTHLANLEKLFASLRHRAFRGELTPDSTRQATELAIAG
jgi:type I restriction enzyme S subunit